MKKHFQSAIALLLTLCLCSCAEAPENVKEQESILDNVGRSASSEESEENPSSSTSDVEIQQKQRGTLDDIRAQLTTDISQNTTRVKVQNAYVSDTKLMPTYGASVADMDVDKIKPLVEYLFAESYNTDDKKLYQKYLQGEPQYPEYPASEYPCDWNNDGQIETANSYPLDMVIYSPVEDNISISVTMHETGVIGGSQLGALNNEYYQPFAFQTQAKYNLLVDDISEVSYKMLDGSEWRLEDAVKYTEDFYNEQMKSFEVDSITFRVKDVYVQALGNDCFGYYMMIICCDENGNYIDSSRAYLYDGESVVNGESFYVENQSWLWTYEKDAMCTISKDYSLTDRVATDSGDDLLTLSAAINIIDKTLAKEIPLEIPCAELCYVVACKEFKYIDSTGVDRTALLCDEAGYDRLIALRHCNYELRPTWVFRTSTYSNGGHSNNSLFFVDAKTGNFYIAM